MDHVGSPPMQIAASIQNYKKSTSEVGPCNPPYDVDARTHLNGPYVSLRKVQKQMELERLRVLECRRFKLKSLLLKDKQGYMEVLLERGLTLYTDSLW